MTVTIEPQEAFCHTQAPVNWLLVPTEPLRMGGKQVKRGGKGVIMIVVVLAVERSGDKCG